MYPGRACRHHPGRPQAGIAGGRARLGRAAHHVRDREHREDGAQQDRVAVPHHRRGSQVWGWHPDPVGFRLSILPSSCRVAWHTARRVKICHVHGRPRF